MASFECSGQLDHILPIKMIFLYRFTTHYTLTLCPEVNFELSGLIKATKKEVP
jgi:hypothetical protein